MRSIQIGSGRPLFVLLMACARAVGMRRHFSIPTVYQLLETLLSESFTAVGPILFIDRDVDVVPMLVAQLHEVPLNLRMDAHCRPINDALEGPVLSSRSTLWSILSSVSFRHRRSRCQSAVSR